MNRTKRSVRPQRRRSCEAYDDSPWPRATDCDVEITNVVATSNSANSDVSGCLTQPHATSFWVHLKSHTADKLQKTNSRTQFKKMNKIRHELQVTFQCTLQRGGLSVLRDGLN
jgi:hypothetical protein